MSSEALVNISLSQLTSLSLDESTKMYEYYSLAEKQLKVLLLKLFFLVMPHAYLCGRFGVVHTFGRAHKGRILAFLYQCPKLN